MAGTARHHASFQAANNTALVSGASAAQRGVVSGLLSLSRNLGLVTGASASPAAIALGMHGAFAIAAGLIAIALAAGAAVAQLGRETLARRAEG